MNIDLHNTYSVVADEIEPGMVLSLLSTPCPVTNVEMFPGLVVITFETNLSTASGAHYPTGTLTVPRKAVLYRYHEND